MVPHSERAQPAARNSNIERSLVMVASTLTHQPDPAIPNIVCPKCGLRMQVAAIEPAGNKTAR